jgi:hypothetical protein
MSGISADQDARLEGAAPLHSRASQRPFDNWTLVPVSLLCGIVLWHSLFPGFYYLAILFVLLWLWMFVAGLVAIRVTIATFVARRKGTPIDATGWLPVLGVPLLLTVAAIFKLPLHASFALARADFEHVIAHEVQPTESFPLLKHHYGLYPIRQTARRRCHDPERIYFQFSNDGEAAIVYSPTGIDDLCFNSGSKGHLVDNWYWMKAD